MSTQPEGGDRPLQRISRKVKVTSRLSVPIREAEFKDPSVTNVEDKRYSYKWSSTIASIGRTQIDLDITTTQGTRKANWFIAGIVFIPIWIKNLIWRRPDPTGEITVTLTEGTVSREKKVRVEYLD